MSILAAKSHQLVIRFYKAGCISLEKTVSVHRLKGSSFKVKNAIVDIKESVNDIKARFETGRMLYKLY